MLARRECDWKASSQPTTPLRVVAANATSTRRCEPRAAALTDMVKTPERRRRQRSPRSTPCITRTPSSWTTESKGGAREPHQGVFPGDSGRVSPAQLVSPGPVSTDFWLGPNGVAATVGKAMGCRRRDARERIVARHGGIRAGASRAGGGSRADRDARSERTANVSGANYVVDGGLIKTT